VYRTRRDLLLGGSMNASGYGYSDAVMVNLFCLPVNYGNFYYQTMPDNGYVLPGWNKFANPSIPASGFNPVFTGMVPSSVITTPLPDDFGITAIKNSNLLAIQDNATVTPGIEEYEVLNFLNGNIAEGVTNNPVFLARTI
jgi:hypothetical protein